MISNLFVYFSRFFRLEDVRLSRMKGSVVVQQQQKQCRDSKSATKPSSGKNTHAFTSTRDLRSTKQQVVSSALRRSSSEGFIRSTLQANHEEEKVEGSGSADEIMNLASIYEEKKEKHTLAEHRTYKSQNSFVTLTQLELNEDDESCNTNVEVAIARVGFEHAELKEWSEEISNLLELGSKEQEALVENEDEFVENPSQRTGPVL